MGLRTWWNNRKARTVARATGAPPLTEPRQVPPVVAAKRAEVRQQSAPAGTARFESHSAPADSMGLASPLHPLNPLSPYNQANQLAALDDEPRKRLADPEPVRCEPVRSESPSHSDHSSSSRSHCSGSGSWSSSSSDSSWSSSSSDSSSSSSSSYD